MANPPSLSDVKDEYERLFQECTIDSGKVAEINQTVNTIVSNRQRYELASGQLGTMPWWFVALVHAMEASLKFNKHLHNGDPLTARTVQVPAGRPAGNPSANPTVAPGPTNPYTWEESAQDALRMKRLDSWTDWSVGGSFYKLEEYNGWGYRQYHSTVLTPYLWSYTNKYVKGKYASDGHWDANLVSKQPGAAALLRRMVDNGTVSFKTYGSAFTFEKGRFMEKFWDG
jgi:lysozyme family protein